MTFLEGACYFPVPCKSVPQECPVKVSHKSVPSKKSVPRLLPNGATEQCCTLLHKRVSSNSVAHECPTRGCFSLKVSYTRVSSKSATRVSHMCGRLCETTLGRVMPPTKRERERERGGREMCGHKMAQEPCCR